MALAQNPTPIRRIEKIVASQPFNFVTVGHSTTLTIRVIDSEGNDDQSLGTDVVFKWSADHGNLPVDAPGNTSVQYAVPETPGTYTVTVTAGSNCLGECTATFEIRTRFVPPLLIGDDDVIYNGFGHITEGGYTGIGHSFEVSTGTVPEGEFIYFSMTPTGPANNRGMAAHRYTLGGNKYEIIVVDKGRNPISSYRLDKLLTICIAVPEEWNSQFDEVEMLAINEESFDLNALQSSVIFEIPHSVCGRTANLPITVAAGIPGMPIPLTPSTIESEAELPPTGGGSPPSSKASVWIFVFGMTLIAGGIVAVYRRRTTPNTR